MAARSDFKTEPSVPRTTGYLANAQFRIRRFQAVDGQEIKLYCRLVKSRPGVAASFNLYEDNRGLEWIEVVINAQSFLVAITDKSFEKYVADELLALGFNKYSG